MQPTQRCLRPRCASCRCDPSPLTPFCEWEAAHEWSWCYQPCQARQFSREEVAALFTRKRVAAVSDSHARNLFSEIASAVLGERGGGKALLPQ